MRVITNREIYHNLSDGAKAGIATGITALTALGVAAAGKPKTLSEIEQKCGKKPLFGKNRKAQWEQCASSQNSPINPTNQTNPTIQNQPMSKNLKIGLIIGSGLFIAAIIGYVIYKRNKR
jgi:hypothetical protein